MKSIKVQGIIVEVSTPYEAGHTISEAEAKALNQVRAENIRNNRAKEIKALIDELGEEGAQERAQALISDYDKEYQFTLASVGGGRPSLDPLEKEARSIARNFISVKIKESGMTQKEYLEKNGEDAIKAKIVELSEHPEVIKAAKKALAERQKMAEALAG